MTQEKQERAIGLLVSLVPQPGTEVTPWYLKSSNEKEERKEKDQKKGLSEEEREKKDRRLKDSLDPMNDMKKALGVYGKREHKKKKKETRDKVEKKSGGERRGLLLIIREPQLLITPAVFPLILNRLQSSQSVFVHINDTVPSFFVLFCFSSLERLRAERLQREAEERRRAQALIEQRSGKRKEAARAMDDRERPYNSAYFPELARKRQRRDRESWRDEILKS